jgi:hypothetical protein
VKRLLVVPVPRLRNTAANNIIISLGILREKKYIRGVSDTKIDFLNNSKTVRGRQQLMFYVFSYP